MISGKVVGGDNIAAKLDALPSRIREGLKLGIGRACLRVMVLTKEKLSGPVLNVRTGRLRRSIARRVEDHSDSVTGIVGTKVEYAGAHEYGFQGTVSVREHLRRAKSGKQFPVRAHSRAVHLPERSFLRSAARELEPAIRSEIQKALVEKLRQP